MAEPNQSSDSKNEIEELKIQLAASNAAFSSVVEKNRDGILIFDALGKIIYANPAVLQLFGKDLGALLGEQIGIFIDTEQITEITIVNTKRHETIDIEINIGDTVWDNQPAKIASLRDVSAHKKLENFLKRLSYFDYLTDLANRVNFEESLKKALSRAKRHQNKVALLYLDLNGFKKVNDTFGHQMGDKLLIEASHVLKSSVRVEDTVARLGGDEFAILIEDFKDREVLVKVVEQIHAKSAKEIILDNNTLSLRFSIGIAIYPDTSSTINELFKHADKAMYVAKKSKLPYQFYSK